MDDCKIRCPRCTSTNNYIKESLGKHFCRKCGKKWPVIVDAEIVALDTGINAN